jgi:acyl carrier protein
MTNVPEGLTLEQQVIEIVAEALGIPPAEVKPHSSLVDDLGAESIDFIDIVFHLESVFDTLLSNEELWAGSVDLKSDDPAAIEKSVIRLRETMPEFPWERFPGPLTRRDLPRLITVNTICAHLRKHLAAQSGPKP